MINIRNLTKKFGNVEALKGIDLTVRSGDFFGLLGPNGAGKTTTINILSTILRPDKGVVYFDGEDLFADPVRAKYLMGVVPQELALYDRLTAVENLQFWGKLYRISPDILNVRIKHLLDLMGITEHRNRRVETFSGGLKRRVNLAVGLVHDPKILFLDEPTVGIDVQSRHRIYDILKKLHRDGKTLIYTSHYLEEVEHLCEKIAIIDHGVIKAEGTLESLRRLVPGNKEIAIKLDEASLKTITGDAGSLPGGMLLTNKGLTGRGNDVNVLLQKMIALCSIKGLNIRDITINAASLESVFLHLTGRELRD